MGVIEGAVHVARRQVELKVSEQIVEIAAVDRLLDVDIDPRPGLALCKVSEVTGGGASLLTRSSVKLERAA